ncbi:MAG: hypothetical protein ACLFO2_01220 [Candidatus Woesearchaeota archaeon]
MRRARKNLKDMLDNSFALLQAYPTAQRTYTDIFRASANALRHIPDLKSFYMPFYKTESGNFLDAYHIHMSKTIIPFGPTYIRSTTAQVQSDEQEPTIRIAQVHATANADGILFKKHSLYEGKIGREPRQVFSKPFETFINLEEQTLF